jgi:hypothetical protein
MLRDAAIIFADLIGKLAVTGSSATSAARLFPTGWRSDHRTALASRLPRNLGDILRGLAVRIRACRLWFFRGRAALITSLTRNSGTRIRASRLDRLNALWVRTGRLRARNSRKHCDHKRNGTNKKF